MANIIIWADGTWNRPDARLIAEAWKIYKSPLKKNRPSEVAAREFGKEHSHLLRNVHFIGDWDTVGALGVPFSLMGLFDSHDEFYDTKIGANVLIACHALAIDEQREDFEPTIWLPGPGIDLNKYGCY